MCFIIVRICTGLYAINCGGDEQLLLHISNAAADSLRSLRTGESFRKRISVFSGHDTVIAPVLSALGVYRDKFCVWPPYASRIVFEVARAKTIASTGTTTVADSSSKYRGHFVRILFNGEDVTALVPGCASELAEKHSKNIKRWCSVDAFSAYVENMLHPYVRLEEACAVTHVYP